MTDLNATPPPKKPWEYLDEVRKDAEAKAAAGMAPARRRRSQLLWLVPLFLVLAVMAVRQRMHPRPAPAVFTPVEEEASARFGIYLAVQAVKAYRDSAGVLPRSLSAVGLDGDGVEYVAGDSAFVLRTRLGARTISYRSGDDLAPYAGAYTTLRLATQP